MESYSRASVPPNHLQRYGGGPALQRQQTWLQPLPPGLGVQSHLLVPQVPPPLPPVHWFERLQTSVPNHVSPSFNGKQQQKSNLMQNNNTGSNSTSPLEDIPLEDPRLKLSRLVKVANLQRQEAVKQVQVVNPLQRSNAVNANYNQHQHSHGIQFQNDVLKYDSLSVIRSQLSHLCKISTVKKTGLQENHDGFEKLFWEFLFKRNDPSPLLPNLGHHMIISNQSKDYAAKIAEAICEKVTDYMGGPPPCLKMRGLWLVGEIFRDDYMPLHTLRSQFDIPGLFDGFLASGDVRIAYMAEMQAIYVFWKAYARKDLMEKISAVFAARGKKFILQSTEFHNSCKSFYKATKACNRSLPIVKALFPKKKSHQKLAGLVISTLPERSTKNISPQLPSNNRVMPNLPQRKQPLPAGLVLSTLPKRPTNISPQLPNNRVVPNLPQRKQPPPPAEVVVVAPKLGLKTPSAVAQCFIKALDNLLSIPPSSDVSLSASMCITSFVSWGNHQEISKEIFSIIESRIYNTSSQVCSDKCIRVLWIIGTIFTERQSSNVVEMKKLLFGKAAIFFTRLLTNVSTEAHSEMRAIYNYWTRVMPASIPIQILKILNDNSTDLIMEKYSWLLIMDPQVPTNVTMQSFYDDLDQRLQSDEMSSALAKLVQFIEKVVCGQKRKPLAEITLSSDESDNETNGSNGNFQNNCAKTRSPPAVSLTCEDDFEPLDCGITKTKTKTAKKKLKTDDNNKKRKEPCEKEKSIGKDNSNVPSTTQESHSPNQANLQHPAFIVKPNILNKPLLKRTIHRSKTSVMTPASSDSVFTEFHQLPHSTNTKDSEHVGKFCKATPEPLKKSVPSRKTSVATTTDAKLSSGSTERATTNKPGPSKLAQFKEQVLKDPAIVTLGYGSNTYENVTADKKVTYLRSDFSTSEFISCILDPKVLDWDFVKNDSGEFKVKLVRDRELIPK